MPKQPPVKTATIILQPPSPPPPPTGGIKLLIVLSLFRYLILIGHGFERYSAAPIQLPLRNLHEALVLLRLLNGLVKIK